MAMDGPSSVSLEYRRSLARFISPFPSLQVTFPHEGSNGTVLGTGVCFVVGVHRDIAFKFAPRIEYLEEADERTRAADNAEIQEGEAAIVWEAGIYKNLAKALRIHPTIHILNPHLHVREGLFLPRQKISLHDRLLAQQHTRVAIPLDLKVRWANQIVKAAAWFERAGYYHGDLRPANILLDRFNNVVLADFGSSDCVKGYLRSSADVFCPGEFVSGSAVSEQYAVAWCLYNIFHGTVPEAFDISDPSSVEFPPIQHLPFATVIQDGWRLRFESLRLMQKCSRRSYLDVQPLLHRFKDLLSEFLARIGFHIRKRYLTKQMHIVYDNLSVDKANGS